MCLCVCEYQELQCFVFGWLVVQEVSEMVVWGWGGEKKKRVREAFISQTLYRI